MDLPVIDHHPFLLNPRVLIVIAGESFFPFYNYRDSLVCLVSCPFISLVFGRLSESTSSCPTLTNERDSLALPDCRVMPSVSNFLT